VIDVGEAESVTVVKEEEEEVMFSVIAVEVLVAYVESPS
jgi:hypothetical protein